MSYTNLADLIEDPVAEVKSTLDALGILEVINEGEELYDGSGAWAQVIPGPDRITLDGNQQLRHSFTIYVNYLQESGSSTLSELRSVSQSGHDALLADITLNSTCFKCMPTLWHPGFMSRGDLVFAGVQTIWMAENWQTFPLPDNLGTIYTELSDVMENPVAEMKSLIEAVGGVDRVSEGEDPYESGVEVWLLPGRSVIQSSHRARLEHRFTVYQTFLASSTTATFSELRQIGEDVYDAILADSNLSATCQICLPTLWHPGFLRFGEVDYVGITSEWQVRGLQDYTPP